MEADNATFERLALSLEMRTNPNDSKWEVAAMTVDWRADLSGSGLKNIVEQTDEIDVMPRRGYFSNAVQTVCTKVGNMTLGPKFMLVQGCTKRWTPGSVNMKRKNCVLLPAAGRRAQLFHLIFTEPGVHLLVHPCRALNFELD